MYRISFRLVDGPAGKQAGRQARQGRAEKKRRAGQHQVKWTCSGCGDGGRAGAAVHL